MGNKDFKIFNIDNRENNSFLLSIQNGLKNEGYFIAKKLIKLDFYNSVRSDSIDYFRSLEKDKHKLMEPIRGDISAGIKNNVGYCNNKYWHIFRSCFFSWNAIDEKNKNIIKLSRNLSRLRNQVINKKDTYGFLIENNRDIAYTSLSHYPANNGFLINHADSTNGEPVIHFKVELTHKGIDYKEGGFFLIDKKGIERDVSLISQPGDVIFFDGSCAHGIRSIKGNDIGRIALFEIPTKVNEESRFSLYFNDGWTIPSKIIYKISKLIQKTNKIIAIKLIRILEIIGK